MTLRSHTGNSLDPCRCPPIFSPRSRTRCAGLEVLFVGHRLPPPPPPPTRVGNSTPLPALILACPDPGTMSFWHFGTVALFAGLSTPKQRREGRKPSTRRSSCRVLFVRSHNGLREKLPRVTSLPRKRKANEETADVVAGGDGEVKPRSGGYVRTAPTSPARAFLPLSYP